MTINFQFCYQKSLNECQLILVIMSILIFLGILDVGLE